MGQKILILVFIFAVFSVTAADKIQLPSETAQYSEKYVKEDSVSGDLIITNQIVAVFREDVTREMQEKLLRNINGKVIGGIPSMDIYQIGIPNNSASLERAKQLCKQLSKNEYVVHARPRKVPTGSVEKIDLENKPSVKRVGQLDLAPGERSEPVEKDEFVLTIEKHKVNLYNCIKKTPQLHGEIEYRIKVNPEGSVVEIKVLKSSVKKQQILDCLSYKIGKWDDFPENSGEFNRQLEFVFKF